MHPRTAIDHTSDASTAPEAISRSHGGARDFKRRLDAVLARRGATQSVWDSNANWELLDINRRRQRGEPEGNL